MKKRINDYVPTKIQAELHGSNARFKVAVFGRRSGKSTFALNEAIQVCIEKPGAKVWIVAPTYTAAKDIYWRDPGMLNTMLPSEIVSKKNESDLLIEFINSSILQFKGADRNEVLRGSGLDLLILDEVAEFRNARETWEQILMPSLSDRQGKAIFIGTPKGFNFLHELYLSGQGGNAMFKSWRVPTWESGNPWTLTPEGIREIESLKERMTEDAYMQEYGADFRKHTGLVFKGFERETHVKEFDVKETYPLEIAQDFGFQNPTAVIFSYFDNDDNWFIFDEYYEREKPNREHAGKIMAQRNKYKNRTKSMYGDSEDPQSIAEYAEYGWFLTPVIKSKDSILQGISRIEERFKINIVTNRPKLIIHPRCENLIYELERYRWMQQKDLDKNEKDVPEKAYDHLIDCMRYIINMHTVEEPIKLVVNTYRPKGGYF